MSCCSCRAICNTAAWYLFDYTTPKIVTIRSFKVGIINRLVQIVIIGYIIGYVIVYKKGYQETETAQGTVTSKVKGIASTLNRTDLPEFYRQVWDTADFIVPPQQSNAFFVLINAIITPKQAKGVCAEDPNVGPDALCTPGKENCTIGAPVQNGNGIKTGKCVLSPDKKNHTCEIHAWCPVEIDTLKSRWSPLLPQAENFTVLVKNFIEFPKFGKAYKRRNIIETVNNATYLKECHYNEKNEPYCPVFQVGYMVRKANANFTELATKGGIISATIRWNCDLDYGLEYCLPQYEFNRLDSADAQIAPGWNFRFAKEYREDNVSMRDLYKAYGILFVFSIQGKAGKFNAIPLFINIGSGLALLGLATILCDIFLLNVLKHRKYYKNKKYLTLVEEEFANKIDKPDDEDAVLISSGQSSTEEQCRHRQDQSSDRLDYI